MAREPESMMEALRWAFQYFYNVSPIKVIEAVYGTKQHPDYYREKLDDLIQRGPGYFHGGLDDEHQARLAEAIKERYGNR